MKKLYTVMAIIIMMSLLAAACSPAAPAPVVDNQANEVEAAVPAPVEKVTIRVMTFFAYDNPEVEQAVVDAFMDKHPNISVVLELEPYDNIFTKYKTLVGAGDPPDVLSTNYEQLTSFAELGALEPLDSYIAASGLNTSIFLGNTLAMHNIKNVQYGLPATFSNVVLAFNKTMFDEAGVEYPNETWDFERMKTEAAKFLKDTDSDGLTDVYGYAYAWWPMYLFMWNTNILNADGTECMLNKPEAIAALSELVEMQQPGGVAPSKEAMQSQGDWDRFIAGNLAMFPGGPWIVQPFNDNIKDFEWDITHHPAGLQQGTFLYSNSYVMSAGSKQKDAAYEFIRFATGVEAGTIRQKGKFEISAVQEVAENVFLPAMAGAPPANANTFMEATQYGNKLSESVHFQQILDIVQPELDLAYIGAKDIQTAMDDACMQVDALLSSP
jgi:multiple sugar transport system substrate-binding protein